MSKYYYDLHIHSILSPCGDILMTPNNILNMAMLKKLDFISITDHNSTRQLPILMELSKSYDFTIIPGIEVTVKEGFDVLCYFKTLSKAISFGNIIENYLLDDWGKYTKENQILTDIYDQELSTFNKPLIKTNISYELLVKIVKEHSGIVVLAHIDRTKSSILNTYTLEEVYFDGIELQKSNITNSKIKKEYQKYKIFINSDAHDLYSISEQESFFNLKDNSIESFFKFMESNNE